MELPEEDQTEVVEDEVVEQSDNSVVDESEGETPQAPGETEEFEIDLGSDEQESQSSAQVPAYKLGKLRKRAQKAEKQLGASSEENEALKAELESLRKDVAKVTAGPRPDPMDYASTEDFYQALDDYNGKIAEPVARQQQPAARPAVQADEAFFNSHYEKAADLPLKKGEFEEAEGRFREQFVEAFGGQGQLMADLVLQEAGDNSPLVSIALGKNDNETQKLIKALNNDTVNGTRTAEKIIWKLSERAKLKPKRNRVATEPGEVPKGRSNAGSLSDQISKAATKWRENSTVANYKKLQDLRKQANG